MRLRSEVNDEVHLSLELGGWIGALMTHQLLLLSVNDQQVLGQQPRHPETPIALLALRIAVGFQLHFLFSICGIKRQDSVFAFVYVLPYSAPDGLVQKQREEKSGRFEILEM